jgi:hypothetical protein
MKNLLSILVAWLMLSFGSSLLAQWTAQYSGLPAGLNTKQLYFVAIDENNCWATLVNDNNSHGRFIRTINGGTTWTSSVISGATTLLGCNMTAVDANNAWIVFDSTAGSTTSSGIFRTTDGGLNWTKQIAAVDPRFIYFFDSSNGVVIGNPQEGYWAIYTTTDGGSSWNRVPSSNIPTPISGERIEPGGAPSGFGNNFWFATIFGNGNLYRTTDKGLTWSRSTAIPGAIGMAAAFENNLVGLVSSDFPSGFRRTTDGGQTFSTVGTVSGITPHYLTAIPGKAGAYMMTNFDLFGWLPGSAYTLDTGNTWITIDHLNHGRNDFVSAAVGWSGGGNDSLFKYIGNVLPVELTSFTVKVQSQTVILNWVTATELNNLGFEVQRKVAEGDFATVGFIKGEGTTTNQKEYSYADKNLAEGKYFYRLKQLDFNGTYEYSKTIEVDVRSLDNFTLEQNYPNPFNPSTKISWQSPISSHQALKIYDVLGNEVATLVDEFKPAGSYEVEFSAKGGSASGGNAYDLPSGVYFYKLDSGNFTEVKKMILLR